MACMAPIRRWAAKNLHYLELHYMYILFIGFFFAAAFYFQPGTNWAFVDALFMSTTAVTNTGINTIALSNMSNYQIAVLYFASVFGSHILMSMAVVLVRKHYFSKRFKEVIQFNKARKLREQHAHSNPHHSHLRRSRFGSRRSFLSEKSVPPLETVNLNLDPHLMEQGDQIGTPSASDYFQPRVASDVIAMFYKKQKEEDQKERDRAMDPEKVALPTGALPEADLGLRRPPLHTARRQSMPSMPHHHLLHQQDPAASMPASPMTARILTPFTADTNGDPSMPNNSNINSNNNIMFADNIDQQRKRLRTQFDAIRRLQQPVGSSDAASVVDNLSFQDMDKLNAADIISLAFDQNELTREQRYRVGGAEYRALDLLSKVIPCYFLFMTVGTGVIFRIYVAVSSYAQDVLATANAQPINPWYMSLFVTLSAFDNLGLTHLDASMVPFQNCAFPLLLLGFLVLAGNTAYPICLRFLLWVMYKLTPRSFEMHRETLQYLLSHPRRCYTTLFGARQTWWLLASLLAINIIELVVYVATNYWLPVNDGVPIASQVLDGLFQGIVTRNAGFAVTNLMALNPATILVYIVAMYISVYPVAITMRNSNVYQERSLGMYRSDTNYFEEDDTSVGTEFNGTRLRRHRTINSVVTASKTILKGPDFFMMTQIQRQITNDIAWVIVGVFCICALEARAIISPSPVTMASVIFEVCSAFGNVGGSLGFPNTPTSQSAQYCTASKLVLIILMFRGRHRGLPAAIDRAVLLPSEQLEQSDAQEQQLQRLHRSPSNITGITTARSIASQSQANIHVYR